MRPVARLLIASYCILAYAETRHRVRSLSNIAQLVDSGVSKAQLCR